MSFCHMRIARPVSELESTASMYCAGLGLQQLEALPIMKDSAG